jgi:hypothetical protein
LHISSWLLVRISRRSSDIEFEDFFALMNRDLNIWPSVQQTQKSFSTTAGDPIPVRTAVSRRTTALSAAERDANLFIGFGRLCRNGVDDGRRPLWSLVHQLPETNFGVRRKVVAKMPDNARRNVILADGSQCLKCNSSLRACTQESAWPGVLQIYDLLAYLDLSRTAVRQVHHLGWHLG